MDKQEFAILKQYLKDFSYEAPNFPKMFFNKEQINANIALNIDIKIADLKNGIYDVALSFKVHNTYAEDKSIFLIELTYSGVVKINIEEEEKKNEILFVKVPALLFPFARKIVAETTSESGFPPLVLNPIDWESFYKQRLEEKKVH